MKKTISALLAIATVAGSLVTAAPSAKADGGRIAAGVAGGLIRSEEHTSELQSP